MARQLARLRVDVIEAGLPDLLRRGLRGDARGGAPGRAAETRRSSAAWRASAWRDIDRCWEAVKYAGTPRIHTFVATSDIHLKYKLRKSRAESARRRRREAVRHARGYCEDVEFSPEDASRTGLRLHVRRAGGDDRGRGDARINIPDTVGYAIPTNGARADRAASGRRCTASTGCVMSVHCHNDLGLAVANSLAGASRAARGRSSARSTASASAPATPRSRRS